MGIEPTYLAWKASTLTIVLHPLSESRDLNPNRTPPKREYYHYTTLRKNFFLYFIFNNIFQKVKKENQKFLWPF